MACRRRADFQDNHFAGASEEDVHAVLRSGAQRQASTET